MERSSGHSWSLLIFLLCTIVLVGTFFFWFIYFISVLGLSIPKSWLCLALVIILVNIFIRFFAYELRMHSKYRRAYFAEALLQNRFSKAFPLHILLSIIDLALICYLLLITHMSTGAQTLAALLAIARIVIYIDILHKENFSGAPMAPRTDSPPTFNKEITEMEKATTKTLAQIQEELLKHQDEREDNNKKLDNPRVVEVDLLDYSLHSRTKKRKTKKKRGVVKKKAIKKTLVKKKTVKKKSSKRKVNKKTAVKKKTIKRKRR